MRAPAAEAVFAIACEDVRQEASGRLSLMGVFGPTIQVEELPIILPALCAVLTVRNPAEPLRQVAITVLDSNGVSIVPTTSHDIPPPTQQRVSHQFQIKIAPVALAVAGPITFRWTFNGSVDLGAELSEDVKVGPATPSV